MALSIDVNTSANGASGSSNVIATSAYTSVSANEVFVLFIAWMNFPSSVSAASVSSTSLTFTQRVRNNGSTSGSSLKPEVEIWTAQSSSVVTSETTTVTLGGTTSGPKSITVVSFTGADMSGTNGSGAVGATNSGTDGGSQHAASLSLTTTRNNSWVWGTAHDPGNAAARTVGSGQTMVHEFTETTQFTDSWVQRQTATTATSGTVVTINDTAPTNSSWAMGLIEILPPASGRLFLPPLLNGLGAGGQFFRNPLG